MEPITSPDPLAPLRADPARAGILLDFDGTLSPIARHPGEAAPVTGAVPLLDDLAARYAVVAVISGRPAAEVAGRLRVPGLRIVGRYGLDAADLPEELFARVEAAASRFQGAWVEPKGVSAAVHYRETPDPDAARGSLLEALTHLGHEYGLEVLTGKMVVELVPAGSPRKGGVVARLIAADRLRAALYAGDDLADLEAFDALDSLEHAVRVAVAGPETPAELTARADLTVDGPEGLVGLLGYLRA